MTEIDEELLWEKVQPGESCIIRREEYGYNFLATGLSDEAVRTAIEVAESDEYDEDNPKELLLEIVLMSVEEEVEQLLVEHSDDEV